MRETLRFRVVGRVQGVGYRAFSARAAQALGLTGRARNLADGSVEVIAQGADPRRLQPALEEGPALARVERVEAAPFAEAPDYPDFRIAP
jgi:acylphosphatase